MKKRVIVLGMMLMFVLTNFGGGLSVHPAAAADVAPEAATAGKTEIESVVAGNNAFAFDLYAKLAARKGNLFFSPYSISTALAMTYAGASGETARQMAAALHFNLSPNHLHAAQAALIKMLNAPGQSYQLAVANALWGQSGLPFQPEFLELTRQYYGAGLQEVDYATQTERARVIINQWVEEQTHHKITELIKRGMLDALTRLVLTNAIYFKGKWETQFKTENTQQAPFYMSDREKANIPLMYQEGKFRYGENGQMQILELPYSGADLSMLILLPKPSLSLKKLEAGLTPENLRRWLSRLSSQKADVFLPRFKLTQEFTLNNILQELGMKDAFDEQLADFSGMTSADSLYITGVVHKAFVETNEEGTEAAAATAVIMGGKSIQIDAEPFLFRADHPFVFLIRDRRSGSVLFMGRVADPWADNQ